MNAINKKVKDRIDEIKVNDILEINWTEYKVLKPMWSNIACLDIQDLQETIKTWNAMLWIEYIEYWDVFEEFLEEIQQEEIDEKSNSTQD